MGILGFAPQGYRTGQESIWGIAGTEIFPTIGRRDQQIFYVNSAHANASDFNYGLDPDHPLATVQELMDRVLSVGNMVSPSLQNYDIVYVGGTVAEDVTTGDYDDFPSYVSIIGAGPGMYAPAWTGNDANTTSLDLGVVGWRIANFRFYGKTGAPCIELHHTDVTGNDIAIRTVIDHCLFDGLTTGIYGIWSHGCYDVWITDNTFQLFHNAVGGGAIPLWANTTPLAIPYRNHILRNIFWDSDNGAVFPCNGSEIAHNLFQPTGYAYAMTQVLNTSVGGNPGDDNVVYANTFPDDYSIAGGYTGGAADIWIGNFAPDIAEAEVADNGFTILPPA
jgi:hypothetical protein